MAWRMPFTLWPDSLSITTMSPRRGVGTRSCSTHARNVSPLTGPSMTQGAVMPSWRRAPMKVVVFQCPCGTAHTSRLPLAHRPQKPRHLRGRAAFVDEDHALRFHVPLTGAPFHARLG